MVSVIFATTLRHLSNKNFRDTVRPVNHPERGAGRLELDMIASARLISTLER